MELLTSVTNNGAAAAEYVRMVSTLPSFLRVVEATASRGEPVVSGTTVTLEPGTLAPGEEVLLRVVVQVNSAAMPPGNVNRIEATTSSADAQPENNVVSITILTGGL